MGLRDVEDMLEAAKADAVRMERALAGVSEIAERRLRSEHASVTDAGYWAEVKRVADDGLAGRPITGVLLTPEEADLAAAALRTHAQDLKPMSRYRANIADVLVAANTLAERLEATS